MCQVDEVSAVQGWPVWLDGKTLEAAQGVGQAGVGDPTASLCETECIENFVLPKRRNEGSVGGDAGERALGDVGEFVSENEAQGHGGIEDACH